MKEKKVYNVEQEANEEKIDFQEILGFVPAQLAHALGGGEAVVGQFHDEGDGIAPEGGSPQNLGGHNAHQDHQGKTQTDYTQRLGKEGAFFTVLSPTAFYNNFRIHSFTLLSSANRSVREPDSSAHCAGRTYAAETFSHDLSDFYHSGR